MPAFAPRKPLAQPRDTNVVVRLTSEEYDVLSKYADAAGQTRADFVRTAIGAHVATAPAVNA